MIQKYILSSLLHLFSFVMRGVSVNDPFITFKPKWIGLILFSWANFNAGLILFSLANFVRLVRPPKVGVHSIKTLTLKGAFKALERFNGAKYEKHEN